MRSRLRWFASCLVFVGCGGAGGGGSGGTPAPTQSASATRLAVHEWGVWVLRDGRVDFDDLARESPPFVHRANGVPISDGFQGETDPESPILPDRPVVVRKPVLFFHASAPTDVTVRVGFHGGQPWLHFPAAANVVHAGSPGLAWSGRVGPDATIAQQPVPDAHWWKILRSAGGDLFRASGTAEAEPFLFYDGPAQFQRPFRIEPDSQSQNGITATPLSTESRVWIVRHGTFADLSTEAPSGALQTRDARPDIADLRNTIRGELMNRGLNSQEAAALLNTWNAELFEERAPHAIYFLPRAEYDRALPIEITPEPNELVRVGLILETL